MLVEASNILTTLCCPNTCLISSPVIARWLAWRLLPVLAWGLWAILSKLIADEISSPAHIQAASPIGIVPVVVALWMMKESPAIGSARRGVLLAFGAGIVSCL